MKKYIIVGSNNYWYDVEAQKIILEMSKCTRYQQQHFLLFALIHLSPIAGARKEQCIPRQVIQQFN